MDIKIAMAGLAHGHGIGFLNEALMSEGVSVTGFYDNENTQNAIEAAEKYDVPVFDDLDELLNNSGANTLLTAAVNAKKADIVVRAIDAGLNVISDKPLVTTMKDLDRIEEALERNRGAKLYLMLTERYNPVLVTAKSHIEAGEIGNPVNIINIRPHKLRPERRPAWMFDSLLYGGIINDIGVHDIDIATWLGGSDVEDIIAATVSNRRFTDITDFNDNGEIFLKLKNGCTAFLLESWLTPDKYPYHGEMKFIIHGTHGQITADPQNSTVTLYSDTRPPHEAKLIKTEENYVTDALKYFSDSNHKPSITTEDGIKAQRVALACQLKANG